MKINIFMSDATTVILSIVVIALIVFLTYLLIKKVIKEIKVNKAEKALLIEGVLSKSEMNSLIGVYMNRMGDKTPFHLIYIDLDKLDDFVLAFGKEETNNILKEVSNKIKRSLPKNAYISNYENDDFLVFLPNEFDQSDVLVFAEKILEKFQEKTKVFNSDEIDLTASIAIAQYPIHGRKINSLIESLRLAIYKIKKDGGNSIKVYTNNLNVEEEHMNYYYQVKKAISKKEFSLYYQPMFNIEKNKVYAYEALLRWNHPEYGVISPAKFINILEQSGDIHWVGTWGFEKLVSKHLELRHQNSQNIPLLSINLSPKQLMNEEISKEFYQILRRNKVEAKNFILEIGEFALFDKQEIILENLLELKELGFKLAIDGFGLDIRSFDRLDQLQIDVIKLDYKFLEEETFAVKKYMELLTGYSNDSNKLIIVQGIETKEDEDKIKKYNLSYTQGYYYSKPFPDRNLLAYDKNIDKKV